LARSHFSYEKRRKELEKKKKKEAKRLAKAERKAALEEGKEIPEPVVVIDEFGNAVEVVTESEEDEDSPESNDASEETSPA
jgi:S-adenosylmethionine hydrolase